MTQSLKVWRSMPAASAASFRLMPDSALAIASSRRATRVFASAFASLRSTAGVRSPLMVSAAMMSYLQIMARGDHDLSPLGIAAAQQSQSFCTAVSHLVEARRAPAGALRQAFHFRLHLRGRGAGHGQRLRAGDALCGYGGDASLPRPLLRNHC